jgi:hypothetical protein
MLNRFAELPATHNQLSVEGARNVTAVYKSMSNGTVNLAAIGLMDVAYDMHAHGTPDENKLAEHIVAGIAKGLKIAAAEEKRYPVCPHCGRRHK